MVLEVNGVEILQRDYSQEQRDAKSIQNAFLVGKGFSALVDAYRTIVSKNDNELSSIEKQIKKDYEDLQESFKETTSDLDILKRMILFYQENYGAKVENDNRDGKKRKQEDLQRSENILLKYCLGERINDRIQDPYDKKLYSAEQYYAKIKTLVDPFLPKEVQNNPKAPLYVIAYVLQELGYNERYIQLQDGDIDTKNIEHIDLLSTLGANNSITFSKDLLRNVLLFQIDNGLQPDGLVGVRFLQKLYYLYSQHKNTQTQGENQTNQKQSTSDPISPVLQDTFSEKNDTQMQERQQDKNETVVSDNTDSKRQDLSGNNGKNNQPGINTDSANSISNNVVTHDYEDLVRQKDIPRVVVNGPLSRIPVYYKNTIPAVLPENEEDELYEGDIENMICKKYGYRGTESKRKTSRLIEDQKIEFTIPTTADMLSVFQKEFIFEDIQKDTFVINIKEFGKQKNYEVFLQQLGYFIYYFGGEQAYQNFKNITTLTTEKNAIKTIKFNRKTGKFTVYANYLSGVSFTDLYNNNVEYVGIFTKEGWSENKIFFEKNQGEPFSNSRYQLLESKNGKDYYVLKGKYAQAGVVDSNK